MRTREIMDRDQMMATIRKQEGDISDLKKRIHDLEEALHRERKLLDARKDLIESLQNSEAAHRKLAITRKQALEDYKSEIRKQHGCAS